jgi:hypothetical protein
MPLPPPHAVGRQLLHFEKSKREEREGTIDFLQKQ